MHSGRSKGLLRGGTSESGLAGLRVGSRLVGDEGLRGRPSSLLVRKTICVLLQHWTRLLYDAQPGTSRSENVSGTRTAFFQRRLGDKLRKELCFMSLHTPPRRGRGFDRKTMQLCKHVARELNQVISGECDDDVLRDLMIVDVQPLDGAAQLLVVVQPYDLTTPPDRPLILKKLAAVKSKLRFAIGETISRRKVPDFVFRVSGITPEMAEHIRQQDLKELAAAEAIKKGEVEETDDSVDDLESNVDAIADIDEIEAAAADEDKV